MADDVTYPIPDGTIQGTDTIGGIVYPRAKVVWGPDGTVNDADVASGKPMPVQLRGSDGTDRSNLLPVSVPTDPFGANADAASATGSISAKLRGISTALGVTALDLGSGTGGTRTLRTILDSSQLSAAQTAAAAMSAGYQLVAFPTDGVAVGAEDQASADGHTGLRMLVVRKATPANSSGTDGDYEFLQTSGGYLWTHDNKGLSNLVFSAAFSTLTRPANTTAYTAGDSISDNATAGSVTALSATISDVNDDPMFISEILVTSTDTGLAGKRIRAYLYNSDPTASSGVSGGDNAAFSNKKAGYIGSMSGRLEAGFSDGTPGRLVPSFQLAADTTDLAGAPASGFIVTKPTSGAKTLFIQFQAIDAFTPSANSTTIIATVRGWQARAV